MDTQFIDTPVDFASATRSLDALFVPGARFPDRVFRALAKFRFADFDFTMMPEFWSAVSELAVLVDGYNTTITTMILDPDPETYFRANFGYYNVFRLPASATADDYSRHLAKEPAGSSADAIYINSFIAAWFSETGRWGVWGERNRGVAVFGVISEVDWETWISKHQPMSSSREFAGGLSMDDIPRAFSRESFTLLLTKNYPAE